MVFPFDLATRSELANEAYAPNGFYLDLAKSRYLDINVKKEMLAEGANGLVEDTRFNKPAKDGDEYTEEGIYTITASNPSTGQETIKKIYVGNNPVLKCYAVTGLPVETIEARLAEGDVIDDDGVLVVPERDTVDALETEKVEEDDGVPIVLTVLATIAVLVFIAALVLFSRRKRRVLPEAAKRLEAIQGSDLPNDGKEESQ